MKATMSSIELSIIVPVLNEIAVLPKFFAGLQQQRVISYEVIVVDGGSRDGSLQWLQRHQQSYSYIKVISSAKGRARQLNTGATHASASWLLFLHVDSFLSNPLAINESIKLLNASAENSIAGHFPLSFQRAVKNSSFGFYFYEAKTFTNRSETIHGDQGFLLSKDFFLRLGRFDETLPVMEDTDFAERLRKQGRWLTLPYVLTTSARRFEVEGLWQRQLLGALIMCFRTIGWHDFLCCAPDVYRQQKDTSTLLLTPFFNLVNILLRELPSRRRDEIWRRSGQYVRGHAWQLFFALDSLISYLLGRPSGKVIMPITRICGPIFNGLTANTVGNFLMTYLLKGWFYGTVFIISKVENIRLHR